MSIPSHLLPTASPTSTRFPSLITSCVLIASLALSAAASAGEPTSLQPRSGDPVDGLTQDQLDRFLAGKDAFGTAFAADEGLGPVFNDNSCSSCHNDPASGGAGTITVTRFGRWDGNTFDPLEQYGGSLLQAEVINVAGEDTSICQEEVPLESEGWVDGANHSAFRVTNSTLGLGLVESIQDSDILANEGVYGGTVHMVAEIEHPDFPDGTAPADRVGRLGWKAQLATVLSFSADAALMEQGLTSYLLPDPVAPMGDESLLAFCDQWGPAHPQDNSAMFGGVAFIDRITDFQRFLAPPPQTPRNGMTGEQIFSDIGCAQCHQPSFVTDATDKDLEDALSDQQIKPYSDFLLHSMGIAADSIEQGDAEATEIRTPSLWGLRDREALLHNGTAIGGTLQARVEDVLDAHDSTFASSYARDASVAYFNDLTSAEQTLLIWFLDSLGRAEFDFTGDLQVTDADFDSLVGCYTGVGGEYLPANWAENEFGAGAISAEYLDASGNLSPMDHPCAVFDFNQDGAIDEADFDWFLVAYDGNQDECALWLQLDEGADPGVDVVVPSECIEPECPGDVTGEGDEVNVDDLLVVLNNWGPCADPEDCAGDITGEGDVNVDDLLSVLNNWGPCPTAAQSFASTDTLDRQQSVRRSDQTASSATAR